LCSGAAGEVENFAVERPRAKSLRRSKPEQSVPGARTRLKFSVEELALVVEAIGYASRCCHAKPNSHFLLCLLIVKETVLTKESDAADAKVLPRSSTIGLFESTELPSRMPVRVTHDLTVSMRIPWIGLDELLAISC
jgi:hypothetical protein